MRPHPILVDLGSVNVEQYPAGNRTRERANSPIPRPAIRSRESAKRARRKFIIQRNLPFQENLSSGDCRLVRPDALLIEVLIFVASSKLSLFLS